MTLFCRKNLINGLRGAVVLGGIGLGLVMPPSANAFGGLSSTDPTESFASQARQDTALAEEAFSQSWQFEQGEFGAPEQPNTTGFFPSAGSNYSDSFRRAGFDHGWDNGPWQYWHGEGWRPFQGGGWWHEHWHCDDCGKTTSPIPEVSTTIMMISGLLGLVIALGRRGQRPLLRLH